MASARLRSTVDKTRVTNQFSKELSNKPFYDLDNGNFVIVVTCDTPSIVVLDDNEVKVWAASKAPFIQVANYSVLQPPILNGNYQLHEEIVPSSLTQTQTIDCDGIISTDTSLSIPGTISAEYDNILSSYNYTFLLSTIPNSRILSFDITVYGEDIHDAYNTTFNRIFLSYDTGISDDNEAVNFYGFGESFTYLNLKGRIVPILVSEQGVGRGLEPITDYFNANIAEGAGGDWYTTYAPKAAYMTDTNKGLVVDQSSVTIFDLTSEETVVVEAWSTSMRGHLFSGDSWLELIEMMTNITGRPPARLPSWSQQGAVVGLEGGTANVTKIVNKLLARGVPLAGVWLQDWVGMRHSWDGDRLIWNWEVNYDWYPGWDEMVEQWASIGTKVLTYISPFFSDPRNFTSSSSLRRNFYEEGIANGYFVQRRSPNSGLEPYSLHSLSIEFCMLDTTNPGAIAWIKDIIKEQLITEAHSSGWMCDFGEYLPFDAILNNNVSAAEYHNEYPEAWARIMREAVVEAGQQDDVLFFMRSAWLRSPTYNTLFWLGDQLVSWDGYDGLESAITGALSSGLTGSAITHSDIGGYNSVFTLGTAEGMYFTRSAELLKRWSEFAAFGSGLFRTHIGSSTSSLNAQIYDTDDSIDHFAKFASIFGNLSTYREMLMTEASLRGYPLIRSPVLHYPEDEDLWRQMSRWGPRTSSARDPVQYMFGADFLVAPCVAPNATEVSMYLPRQSGSWTHLWSGKTYEGQGQSITSYAGVGFPLVLYQSNSTFGRQLREFVLLKNFTAGYDPSNATSVGDNTGGIGTDDSVQLPTLVLTLGTLLPMMIIVFLLYIWSGSVPVKLRCCRRPQANQATEDVKAPLIGAADD